MFSYFVIFAGVLAISVSFPQNDFDDLDDRIGFPEEVQLQAAQQSQRPSRPNVFPPFTAVPSTTTVNVPNQSTTPATVTTRSPAYRRCLTTCLTTNEYNPVCGSDNNNYDNLQKLNCANYCGPRVDPNWRTVAQNRMGTCTPL